MQHAIPYQQSAHAKALTRTPGMRLELESNPDSRLNIVLPHFFKNYAFDGIASSMELARVLTTPYRHVRFVSQAPLGLKQECFDFKSHAENARLVESVSLRSGPLLCHQRDVFFCASWQAAQLWMAHNQALEAEGMQPTPCYHHFQEWEPGMLPFGVDHCLCLKTYSRPELIHAVFASPELAHWFSMQGHSFARNHVLHPSLNPLMRDHLESRNYQLKPKARDAIVFLVHGRPTDPRACFPALAEGLYRFVQELEPVQRHGLVFLSVGREHEHLILAHGVELKSLGRLPLERYMATLELAHVGVALSASPQPAYVPLEMAAFGLYTITNRYADKDLSRQHQLIHSLDFPDPQELCAALHDGLEHARKSTGKRSKALLPSGMSPHGLHASALRLGVEPIKSMN